MAHDYLMHYGVLGMKWGVRKSRPSSGGRSSRREERRNERAERRNIRKNYTGSRDTVARRNYQKRDVNKMSDDELKSAITRMNLERQYRDLTKTDYMKGHKVVSNVLKYGTLYAAVTKSPYITAGVSVLGFLNDVTDFSKMNRDSRKYPD